MNQLPLFFPFLQDVFADSRIASSFESRPRTAESVHPQKRTWDFSSRIGDLKNATDAHPFNLELPASCSAGVSSAYEVQTRVTKLPFAFLIEPNRDSSAYRYEKVTYDIVI